MVDSIGSGGQQSTVQNIIDRVKLFGGTKVEAQKPEGGDHRLEPERVQAKQATGDVATQAEIEAPTKGSTPDHRTDPRVEAFFRRFDDGDGVLTRAELERAAIETAGRMMEFSGRHVSPDRLLARLERRLERLGLDLHNGFTKEDMAEAQEMQHLHHRRGQARGRRPQGPHRRPHHGRGRGAEQRLPPAMSAAALLTRFDNGDHIVSPEELQTMAEHFASKVSRFAGIRISADQMLDIIADHLEAEGVEVESRS